MLAKLKLALVSIAALTLAACGQQPSAAQAGASDLEDATPDGVVEIYNGSTVATFPNPLNRGIKVLKNGQKTLQSLAAPFLITEDAHAANVNLTFVRDFFNNKFGRWSYDGKGAKIKGIVEVQRFRLLDFLHMRENAAWFPAFSHMIFGAGGNGLDGFAQAVDVIAHEYTHAVISKSSALGFSGQSGALDEHLADVFGELAQHAMAPDSQPFLIGETVLRGALAEKAPALRDMMNPEKSLDAQPATMADIPTALRAACVADSANDACGRHILNSIPNKAAALIIQSLGWEDAGTLFYTVMTERLSPGSDFADYKKQVVGECETMGLGEKCESVKDAFATVGL